MIHRSLSLAALFALSLVAPALAQSGPSEKATTAIDKGLEFLVKGQKDTGAFVEDPRAAVGITALVTRALARDPKHGPTSEPVKKATAYLIAQQQPNGAIGVAQLANYNTALAVTALAAVGTDEAKVSMQKAVGYLKTQQFNDTIVGKDGKKLDPSDPAIGGWNYGEGRGPADLSNTAIVLDALHDAGLDKNDPAFQNAIKFLSRMQNHSETNPLPWAGNDGGFVYNMSTQGEAKSSAGEYTDANGKKLLRSYGSMTYAGYKSLLYAGLDKNDSRVKAALDWVAKNYTLDEHPGMAANGAEHAKDGIFYYYHAMTRALAASELPKLSDAQGVSHDWRAELIGKLVAEQKADGSFVGMKRWMEDNSSVATPFAVLALQDAREALKTHD